MLLIKQKNNQKKGFVLIIVAAIVILVLLIVSIALGMVFFDKIMEKVGTKNLIIVAILITAFLFKDILIALAMSLIGMLPK